MTSTAMESGAASSSGVSPSSVDAAADTWGVWAGRTLVAYGQVHVSTALTAEGLARFVLEKRVQARKQKGSILGPERHAGAPCEKCGFEVWLCGNCDVGEVPQQGAEAPSGGTHSSGLRTRCCGARAG